MHPATVDVALELRRPAKVWAQIGVSSATGWRMVRRKEFVQPIKISARATGFIASEVDDWIRIRISKARGGAA